MKVAVALLVCDRYAYTKTTCETFFNHNDPADFELYYADDASTDVRVPALVESMGFQPVVKHSRRLGCSATSAKLVFEVARLAGDDALIWYLQNDIACIRPLDLNCVRSVFLDPQIHVLRTYASRKSTEQWKEFARQAEETMVSPSGPSLSRIASDEKRAGWTSFPNPYEALEMGSTYWSFQPSISRAVFLRDLLKGVEKEADVMIRSERMNLRIARFSNNVTVHFGDDRTPDGILDGQAARRAAR